MSDQLLIETAVYTAANGQTVATVDEVAGIRFQSNTPNNEMATVGMRMMISNNFAPKTRLRMASRLLIMEVQISIIFCMGVHLTPVCTGFKENELDSFNQWNTAITVIAPGWDNW